MISLLISASVRQVLVSSGCVLCFSSSVLITTVEQAANLLSMLMRRKVCMQLLRRF